MNAGCELADQPPGQERDEPSVGELAHLLAHDLRTPINAVRGFSELLLSGAAGPLTGEMIDFLAEIAGAGRGLEEAVLCAQELGEPCIMAGEDTRCAMRALLVDAGITFRFRDLPDTVEVTGELAGWRRLLGVCHEHLTPASGKEAPWAEIGAAGAGRLHLVMSAVGGYKPGPPSVLRERLIRRLATSQHMVLVSEPPHRPIRLIARCHPTGR